MATFFCLFVCVFDLAYDHHHYYCYDDFFPVSFSFPPSLITTTTNSFSIASHVMHDCISTSIECRFLSIIINIIHSLILYGKKIFIDLMSFFSLIEFFNIFFLICQSIDWSSSSSTLIICVQITILFDLNEFYWENIWSLMMAK